MQIANKEVTNIVTLVTMVDNVPNVSSPLNFYLFLKSCVSSESSHRNLVLCIFIGLRVSSPL